MKRLAILTTSLALWVAPVQAAPVDATALDGNSGVTCSEFVISCRVVNGQLTKEQIFEDIGGMNLSGSDLSADPFLRRQELFLNFGAQLPGALTDDTALVTPLPAAAPFMLFGIIGIAALARRRRAV